MKRPLLLIAAVVFGFAQFAGAEDQKPNPKDRPVPRGKGGAARATNHGRIPASAGSHSANSARNFNAHPAGPAFRHGEGNAARFRANNNAHVYSGAEREFARPRPQGEAARFANGSQNYNRGRDGNGNVNVNSRALRNARFTVQDRAAVRASHGGNWYSKGGLRFAEARQRHRHEEHGRSYWRSHYNRIVLFGGGYYFYDAGYWYPAYGYDAGYNRYSYDGPIYGYNNLAPDQVLVNVQVALQQDGYYQGEIDGDIGPQTRDALAAYQEANDLEVTAAIDPATLASLGLS